MEDAVRAAAQERGQEVGQALGGQEAAAAWQFQMPSQPRYSRTVADDVGVPLEAPAREPGIDLLGRDVGVLVEGGLGPPGAWIISRKLTTEISKMTGIAWMTAPEDVLGHASARLAVDGPRVPAALTMRPPEHGRSRWRVRDGRPRPRTAADALSAALRDGSRCYRLKNQSSAFQMAPTELGL